MDFNRQRMYQLLPLGALSGIITVIDQLSKIWVFRYLDNLVAEGKALFPARPICDFFNLVKTWNPGISFGLLQSLPYGNIVIVLMTMLILGVTLYCYRDTRDRLELYALAIIVGGALGNLVDRLRFGAVADFLDFYIGSYHWPAFNLADAAICLGVLGLIISELRSYVQHQS